jgi:hypothetical protein
VTHCVAYREPRNRDHDTPFRQLADRRFRESARQTKKGKKGGKK